MGSSSGTSDLDEFLEYSLSGVGILLVSVLGLCGNIVSAFVLKTRHRDTNQTFTDLLVWLAVIDSVFLVLVTMMFSLPLVSPSYHDWVFPPMVPIVLPCTSVAMTASLYTVLALAVERFLTVSASSQRNKVGQF